MQVEVTDLTILCRQKYQGGAHIISVINGSVGICPVHLAITALQFVASRYSQKV